MSRTHYSTLLYSFDTLAINMLALNSFWEFHAMVGFKFRDDTRRLHFLTLAVVII
jgi:hypothetical protein